MFTILDYSSALEYSIIRRYTNIVYYYIMYNQCTWIIWIYFFVLAVKNKCGGGGLRRILKNVIWLLGWESLM